MAKEDLSIVDEEILYQTFREHFCNKPAPIPLDKATCDKLAIRYNANKAMHKKFCEEIYRELNLEGE